MIEIDRAGWAVIKDGKRIKLTHKEFLIVDMLAKRPGMVRSHAQLAEAAEIDADPYVAVRSHIKRLRAKGIKIETRYDIGLAWPA